MAVLPTSGVNGLKVFVIWYTYAENEQYALVLSATFPEAIQRFVDAAKPMDVHITRGEELYPLDTFRCLLVDKSLFAQAVDENTRNVIGDVAGDLETALGAPDGWNRVLVTEALDKLKQFSRCREK